MSVGYITSLLSISITLGLIFGIYIRLYREGIANKRMVFATKRFLYYQIMVPFILFPKLVMSDKKIFAEFITIKILEINDKNEMTRVTNLFIKNWDKELTWILWRCYLSAINHNYDEFTNRNLELVKKDIQHLKKQNEMSKKRTLNKQMSLLENNKVRDRLLDKLAAASVFV